MRFSQLVVEQRWIKEIDINPLLASPERLIALDARVVLHGARDADEAAAAPGDPALSERIRRAVRRCTMAPGGRSCARSGRKTSRCWSRFHETLSERERLLALSSSTLQPEPADRPRAADAHLLHRLRPRTGAGRRGADAAGRAEIMAVGRLSRTAPDGGGVLAPGRRPSPGAGPGIGAAAAADRDRPREGLRRSPPKFPRERCDAGRLPQARLRDAGRAAGPHHRGGARAVARAGRADNALTRPGHLLIRPLEEQRVLR